jgi:predicted ATPase/signal transduction histidine kinase
MDIIKGYTLLEVINEGYKTVVYRGEREKDHKKVIIKTHNREYPSVFELTQLNHEYEILKILKDKTESNKTNVIIEPIDLVKHKNGLAIILEDFGGKPISEILETDKFEIINFLKIAILITSSIEIIHNNHIIHKDIKPSNIIINQKTGEVKLIDFSVASQLSSEHQTASNLNFLEGTLPYMSPEQTGRMNRSIDYRTDFYSLGVTLYEILTGELPFQIGDPIEMVHCHIAKTPVSPHKKNGKIPETISNIVMKLLSKTAEDRYQTTFGLKADLENCLNQLINKGNILDFPVGQEDLSSQFIIPQKLYGRQLEVAALMAAFERASQGTAEMMLIAGYSGIGKSALVHEINQPIVRQRGFFIEGKFDQFQKSIPYSAFIQAFQELVRQLLTESEEKISVWRDKLNKALGSNGRIIIDVIPDVELIVGSQPQVTELDSTNSQNRFNLVFHRFINVFAQPEHPLAIFLDDLQWADLASLKFIQLIITNPDCKYLLLIGAYRDNEINKSHPLSLILDDLKKTESIFNEITIKPLDLENTGKLIADTLHCTLNKVFTLSELIYQKTNGNPFFINQLFQSLYTDGLLIFDLKSRLWRWDVKEIQEIDITENVVDLMIGKIKKLPLKTQELLKLAACIGSKFNLEVLSTVGEKTPLEISNGLWEGIQEGLIVPQSADYKIPLYSNQSLEELSSEILPIKYKFLHDRVQQAAYELIPDHDKTMTHLKIGRLRLSNTRDKDLEENVFDIVNHLNMGSSLITGDEEIQQLTQLNLMAGCKAKTSTAYEAASRYLTKGIDLWRGDIWQDRYDLAFALYRELSECEYLCSNFEKAEKLFDYILDHAHNHLEKADIQKIRLTLYDNTGKYLENLKTGSEALRTIGLKMPTDKEGISLEFQKELKAYNLSLEKINITALIDAPRMKNPEIRACMQILMNMTGPAYFTDQNLLALIALKMVNLSIEYGNSEVSAHGYAFWGIIAGSRLNDYESGYDFGRLALSLNDKFSDSGLTSRVYNLFGGLISPWRKHFNESIQVLRQGYQAGVETGDVYASYNSSHLIMQSFLVNENFESIIQESNKHIEFLKKTKNYVFVALQELYQHVIFNLQGLTNDKFSFSDENYDELDCIDMWQDNHFLPGIAAYNIFKTQILFIYEDYQNALQVARENKDALAFVSGIAIQVEHYLYYSLSLAALYSSVSELDRDKYWKILEKNLKKLKLWADNCPDNFLHKYLLVNAEMHRISGKDFEAFNLYDLAIESSKKHGFFQDNAIANELAAQFWFSKAKDKIAKVYLFESRYSYHRWGAKRKVICLEEKYPKLLTDLVSAESALFTTTNISSSSSNSDDLDLSTVIKASQALASEIVLSKLLHQLMKISIENAGAQKGFLILEKNGEWVIEAEGKVDSETVTVLQSTPVTALDSTTHTPLLSTAIIYYVANTLESVVLSHAALEGKFIHDPYVMGAQPKSILCAPLINLGNLSGILYLENNLTTGAFTPDRLEVLTLLSSQAAISIENAKLYDNMNELNHDLKQEVSERIRAQKALAEVNQSLEKRVAERTHELSETLEKLKATQAQIIAQEKLASLGSLTAGIAHEIKNPLNFVNNFSELSIDLVREILEEIEPYKEKFLDADIGYIEELLADLDQNSKKINEHGKRADKIVRGMLMHSRDNSSDRQMVNINDLIDQSATLAYHGFRVDHVDIEINIQTSFDESIPKLNVVPQNISRAFLNIINNACHAVSERKQDSVQEYTPTILIITKNNVQDVNIHVRDNGRGIPTEVLDKIFNPFFTTKIAGEGTGLGLSICHDIIAQEHHGRITVNTEVGSYTEFIVTLPK